MRVKGTKQLGSFTRGINLYIPKKAIVSQARTYLYKATGVGLSPDINNLRFYDSGLTNSGQPVYYDETDTYKLYYSGFPWLISLIAGGSSNFAKFSGVGPPDFSTIRPEGNYNGASGWSGTVTISAI
jgi:hypothetical protein